MSALKETQQTIFNLLIGNAALNALLGRHAYEASSPTRAGVYDYVAQPPAPESNVPFPYVVIGDLTAIEFDTDDINGLDQTVTVHVWDRYRGRKRLKQVMDAVYTALHKARLEIVGQNSVFCFWEFSESIPDEEVLTQHGVLRFRIVTMES